MRKFGERRIGPPAHPDESDDRFGAKRLSSLQPKKPAAEEVDKRAASVAKLIKKKRN